MTIAGELAKRNQAVKKICLLNLGDQFIDHGSVPQLRSLCGIDREAIYRQAQEACTGE
jgi:deoxyxylulose-5-phosphate synthase